MPEKQNYDENLRVNNYPGLGIETCMGQAQLQEAKKTHSNSKMADSCPYNVFSNPQITN